MAVSHEDVANFSTLNFANDLSRRNDVGLTFHTLHGQEGKERERERVCCSERGESGWSQVATLVIQSQLKHKPLEESLLVLFTGV